MSKCGNSAPTAQAPTQEGAIPAQQGTGTDHRTAQTKIGDFLISINHCGSDGTAINCSGTVVNQSSLQEMFAIHALKTYMIDDLGGQSTNSAGYVGVGVTIGAVRRRDSMNELFGQVLQPGLPVSFELSGLRMREGAKAVSVVLVTGDGQTILRNIVIPGT